MLPRIGRDQGRGFFEITWSHCRKQMSSSVDNGVEAAEVNSGHFVFLSHFSALWITETVMLDYSSFAPRKLLLNYFQHGWVQRSLCTEFRRGRLACDCPRSLAVLSSDSLLYLLPRFSCLYIKKGIKYPFKRIIIRVNEIMHIKRYRTLSLTWRSAPLSLPWLILFATPLHDLKPLATPKLSSGDFDTEFCIVSKSLIP